MVSQHALQVSGPTPRGRLRGLAGVVSRSTPGGGELRGLAGGSPGPHPGGCIQHALRQAPPQQTATTAGGTHPTGMHSCFVNFYPKLYEMNEF